MRADQQTSATDFETIERALVCFFETEMQLAADFEQWRGSWMLDTSARKINLTELALAVEQGLARDRA